LANDDLAAGLFARHAYSDRAEQRGCFGWGQLFAEFDSAASTMQISDWDSTRGSASNRGPSGKNLMRWTTPDGIDVSSSGR